MPAPKINYALAATLLASGMTPDEIAPQVGAKNSNTLMVGLCKKGVNQRLALAPKDTNRVSMSVVARVANQASDIVRDRLATGLDAHVEALGKVPVRADLKHLKRVAEVIEPLARTAKIVHDWGNEQSLGIVALGIVEHLDQAQDALEVQSSVVPTTTESVPLEPLSPSTPQDTQELGAS